MAKITCPRRLTELGPWEREEGLDRWVKRAHWSGHPRCCSFCGSLEPEYFLTKIEEGLEVGPTDKSFKAYLHDARGGMAGKFYFQHFDQEQQERFTRLLNEKKIKIGFPGHFYRLPFFLKAVDGPQA